MQITVVFPTKSHTAYEIAADAFLDIAKKIGGIDAETITDE